MTAADYTHRVRGTDLARAEKVLNSPTLSSNVGELFEALRTLIGFAEPMETPARALATTTPIDPSLIALTSAVSPHEFGFLVNTTVSGIDLDRPNLGGFVVRSEAVARRLARAVEDGAVWNIEGIRTDIYGKTYIAATSNVLARMANADLRRLGY